MTRSGPRGSSDGWRVGTSSSWDTVYCPPSPPAFRPLPSGSWARPFIEEPGGRSTKHPTSCGCVGGRPHAGGSRVG
eukprot:9413653-Alexandrium_andersonii.AAC.1